MTRLFSSQLIDKFLNNAVVDFLPCEVLFAMGKSEKVECASKWINTLKKENKELKRLGGTTLTDAYEALEDLRIKLEVSEKKVAILKNSVKNSCFCQKYADIVCGPCMTLRKIKGLDDGAS